MEPQDYKLVGKDCELAYKQLRKGKLVESHHELLKTQLESQTLQGQALLAEASSVPQTPRHLATYAHNLLVQVRSALTSMKLLKQREHAVHLDGSLLVSLKKWEDVMVKQPHSHPVLNQTLATTISERLDKNELSV